MARGAIPKPRSYQTDSLYYDNIFYELMTKEQSFSDWIKRKGYDIDKDDFVVIFNPAETYLKMKARYDRMGVELDLKYHQKFKKLKNK